MLSTVILVTKVYVCMTVLLRSVRLPFSVLCY